MKECGFIQIKELKIGDTFFDYWRQPCKLVKKYKYKEQFLTFTYYVYLNKFNGQERHVYGDEMVYPISKGLHDLVVQVEDRLKY